MAHPIERIHAMEIMLPRESPCVPAQVLRTHFVVAPPVGEHQDGAEGFDAVAIDAAEEVCTPPVKTAPPVGWRRAMSPGRRAIGFPAYP